ncbi:MAG TPA: ribokinase [Bacillales bacterium]|nr:ribokinase [Bacillales bacterium]
MSDIIVVGSVNMDMVVNVDKRPAKGETVLGDHFFMTPGGKGANQAYAAAKLGGDVTFIGAMGQDIFRERLTNQLKSVNINTEYIHISETAPTGTAFITIDREGDNSIVVAANANTELTPDILRKKEEAFRHAKLLMIQLEIPIETVLEAVKLAKKHGLRVLLDPAPARELPESLFPDIDFLTPNQTEMEQLTGVKVADVKSAEVASTILLDKGVKTVFAKMGNRGVTVVSPHTIRHNQGYRVHAIDTTAAGDAFAGAVGLSLVEKDDVFEAGSFGNAVAALAVTKTGAQDSVPTRKEVRRLRTGR